MWVDVEKSDALRLARVGLEVLPFRLDNGFRARDFDFLFFSYFVTSNSGVALYGTLRLSLAASMIIRVTSTKSEFIYKMFMPFDFRFILRLSLPLYGAESKTPFAPFFFPADSEEFTLRSRNFFRNLSMIPTCCCQYLNCVSLRYRLNLSIESLRFSWKQESKVICLSL